MLAQSCHEEFQGAPALGGPAPRSALPPRGRDEAGGCPLRPLLPAPPGLLEGQREEFQPLARNPPARTTLSLHDSRAKEQSWAAERGGKAAGEQRGTAHPEQHLPPLEAGMGLGSRVPTLSRGPFQPQRRGPAATQSAPDALFPPLPLPYLIGTASSPSTSVARQSLSPAGALASVPAGPWSLGARGWSEQKPR